ncbi:MAG: SDR family NAD(P)-dependent oxidoreductase [Mycobacteriaceae bacterium]
MNSYLNKIAVVTGAGSGMGRSLSVELARKGAVLAICDIDIAGLEETVRLCEIFGARVEKYIVNVSEREEVLRFAEVVGTQLGKVNYLFNNAGIAFIGTVARTEFKDIERVMDVNFWGVVNGTKAFLPYLIESGDGHIVNTSSIFGLFSVPSQSSYNAAKFAVRGFTESLRQEMLIAKYPVKVSCVHPGGIKTNIAKNSTAVDGEGLDELIKKFDSFALTSAESAAKVILKGTEKGKPKILIGPDAYITDIVVRLMGARYQRLLSYVGRKLLPKSFTQ